MSRTFPRLVVATLSLWATPALGQPQQLVLEASGAFACVPLPDCMSASGCAAGESCSYVDGMSFRVCNLGVDGFFCCNDDADCSFTGGDPGRTDGTGSCMAVPGEGLETFGVCQFNDNASTVGTGEYAPTFCKDLDPFSQMLRDCMTTPGGERTIDWHEGDCDNDDTPNGLDFALRCGSCDATNYADPTGLACIRDAPGGDAGPDASTPDSGAPDSGPVDSSTSDGSSFDTGAFSDNTSFRGVGGCACDVASPAAPPMSLVLVLGVLLLGDRRRR